MGMESMVQDNEDLSNVRPFWFYHYCQNSCYSKVDWSVGKFLSMDSFI